MKEEREDGFFDEDGLPAVGLVFWIAYLIYLFVGHGFYGIVVSEPMVATAFFGILLFPLIALVIIALIRASLDLIHQRKYNKWVEQKEFSDWIRSCRK